MEKHFFELLKNRRSIRKFLQQPVEPDKIDLILKAALMSPASKRTNGWEFWVVQQKNTLEKMAECRPYGSKLLENAPLAIVVTADPSKSDVWFEDASIASIIIQLEATDLGLGSCWVQIYNREKDETISAEQYIKNILNIPEHLHVLSAIAIGYKDEERKPFDIEKLAYEKIHFH
jgi:nitroreductase